MGECCYAVKQIPDLTLGKYDYLSCNGVDGVLELHRVLLRQLHEKSHLTGVSMHLLYVYKHDGAPGSKISIFFLARGRDSLLNNIDKLLKGSSLSEYFTFTFLYRQNSDGAMTEFSEKEEKLITVLHGQEFSSCSMLTKEEVFFEGLDGETYYNVPSWKPNQGGRLYDMIRIMEALNEDFVYRIDIRAVKRNRTLRERLTSGPIPKLHALQGNSAERDYGADTVLRSYDDLLKNLDGQPHFDAKVFVFSNDPENGAMVMASAASEAIQNGDYNIETYCDRFHCRSLLGTEQRELTSLDDDFTLYEIPGKKSPLNAVSRKLEMSEWKGLHYLSTLMTLDELEPFFRLPCLHDGEHIELRKETTVPMVPDGNSLFLGKDSNGYKVNIPLELLPKHAFLSGVPGSGKTNTMHHLTYSLWSSGIPFLVLEPAKKEYRALLNLPEMKDVRLFSPCADMTFPLHINPFEFPRGLFVSEHIRTLCSVFEGAFPLEPPMPFLLENAIEKVYANKGWYPETRYTDKTNLEFPTMSMLYKELEKELSTTTYSGEVKGNLESALKVRIGSLLRREMGDVFDVPFSSLRPEQWLTTPAIVELEAMGQGPANFMTLMLCSLIRECLKVDPHYDGPVRHVIFIEEAHNLIGPDSEEKSGGEANAKSAATAFIVKMLAEVRALKESIFIADQLPTAMAQEVIKNTGLKVALRLTAMDDRQLLCNSMSANNSQIEEMGTFSIGQALVSYEKLQRPFKMRVNLWCGDRGEEERKKIATSRSDDVLQQQLKDNEAYRDNLRSSVITELLKLNDLAAPLFDRQARMTDLIKEVTRLGSVLSEALDACRQAADEASLILLTRYGGDPDRAQSDFAYLDALEQVEAHNGTILDCEDKIEHIVNESELRFAVGLINEMLELGRVITVKYLHFVRLGLKPTADQEALFLEGTDSDALPDEIKAMCGMRCTLLQPLADLSFTLCNRLDPILPIPEHRKRNILRLSKLLVVKPNVKLKKNKYELLED